jgi:hypothetical protein
MSIPSYRASNLFLKDFFFNFLLLRPIITDNIAGKIAKDVVAI